MLFLLAAAGRFAAVTAGFIVAPAAGLTVTAGLIIAPAGFAVAAGFTASGGFTGGGQVSPGGLNRLLKPLEKLADINGNI